METPNDPEAIKEYNAKMKEYDVVLKGETK